MSRRGLQRATALGTLTDGATVSWDVSRHPTATVTLGGNRTLAAATGQVPGETYVLRVVQDGTGSRTLSWNSTYVFHADGPPLLSGSSAADDVFAFVSDGTNMHCLTPQKRGLGPRGHIDGLVMSQDTDTDHDISVSNGEATLVHKTTSEQRVIASLSSTLVKQLDADWAEGSAAGGIASGARSSANTMNTSTWYHFFLIAKTDGTVDAGVDTSVTAANLLTDASSYTFYRRLGSVLSDGSSNITDFQQYGDVFFWDIPVLDVNESIGATGETKTLSVPTGFSMPVYLTAVTNTEETNVYIHSPDLNDSEPSLTAAPGVTLPDNSTVGFEWHAQMELKSVDASAQVRIQPDGAQTLLLWTLGWIDPRGRAVT